MNWDWNLETPNRLKAKRNGINYKTINIYPTNNKPTSVANANKFINGIIKQAYKKHPGVEYQVSFYDKTRPSPFSTYWADNYNEYQSFGGVKTMENHSGSNVPEEEVSVSMIKINSIKKA
jgi:hypothetical protein|tara:strand:+ start:45 stop:404 length:360 start_codon:yes stop_codon:yes gene_type:complete